MKANRNFIVRILIILFLLIGFQNAKADGFIVIRPPAPIQTPFPLEVLYHRVDVEINGLTSVTKIDQSFFNPSDFQLEGYYIFPIPKGAIISDFRMVVNGVEVKAEMLESEKARNIYEEIVRRMKDPALLEYSERDIFKLRIFPIEPRSEKKISITYLQMLEKDNDITEYVYPLNTEKFSAAPLKDVSIKINLKSESKVKDIYSPTHDIDVVIKSDKEALISYEEYNVKPEMDFKLYFSVSENRVDLNLMNYNDGNEDGYFLLTVMPSFNYDEKQIEKKDITFIIDVSGSMTGEKLEQAKNALLYCVDNLNTDDRFEIIKFSTEAFELFGKPEINSKQNIEKAKNFISKMKAAGGTNIDEAFELAFKNKSDGSRLQLVIFITDGKPTIGEINDEKLIQKILSNNKAKARIFTFGIGNEINTHLLDKLTSETKSWRTYISPKEDIEVKVSSFYDKIQSPVISDLKLEFEGPARIYNYYPAELGDLFKGSNLLVFGRYDGEGEIKIKLSGMLNGSKQIFIHESKLDSKQTHYDFIPALWAARRIGRLLDLIRLNGESNELVNEIVDLARQHGIVTPYTSYLIMEDENNRTISGNLPQQFQTLRREGDFDNESITEYKKEYDAMKLKTGESSVLVSKEFQELSTAGNLSQTQQGKDRMYYSDDRGNLRNLGQQVRLVQGRAFYQNGIYWIDSRLQDGKVKNQKRIQFNSEEYFDLLNQNPGNGQVLALGKNVLFEWKNVVYEVYE
ncbi:MAG: VWA domain-containing protein [Ignavibacteriaceae bacterium]|nr:VWA domain-containing protein [Ignavibacteriaceae bacterium]